MKIYHVVIFFIFFLACNEKREKEMLSAISQSNIIILGAIEKDKSHLEYKMQFNTKRVWPFYRLSKQIDSICNLMLNDVGNFSVLINRIDELDSNKILLEKISLDSLLYFNSSTDTFLHHYKVLSLNYMLHEVLISLISETSYRFYPTKSSYFESCDVGIIVIPMNEHYIYDSTIVGLDSIRTIQQDIKSFRPIRYWINNSILFIETTPLSEVDTFFEVKCPIKYAQKYKITKDYFVDFNFLVDRRTVKVYE
jgi:hypothetical protein